MSTKEEIIKQIQGLPENVTLEDIIDELYVRAKIESGINQLDQGNSLSHDTAKVV